LEDIVSLFLSRRDIGSKLGYYYFIEGGFELFIYIRGAPPILMVVDVVVDVFNSIGQVLPRRFVPTRGSRPKCLSES